MADEVRLVGLRVDLDEVVVSGPCHGWSSPVQRCAVKPALAKAGVYPVRSLVTPWPPSMFCLLRAS